MHALNIIRQVLLESRVVIDNMYFEPALMLAVEALVSHVWAMREESSVGGP